ncbi:ATP phosphoribosyltransferase regulatory subunit [Sphaerisporangium sp. NPDC051017]|uniref:ATP phosphoribosyltransferase regulatory subunit n=1 Tax=Sphaerisporangium sp. NPDC051017 TaxID=3154636 RepID=UPI003418A566
MTELNLPLKGTGDIFGLPLRRRLAVTGALANLARRHGYDQVEVPLIERASSFSEEVVGRSPWPEWDQRGCFYLQVPDYKSLYDNPPTLTDALLIPEGTISVTRWLGRLLSDDPGFVWPLKLFYLTPSFRNELIDGLDELKRRQFNQFGLEILGAPSGSADIEAIHLITTSLYELGIPERAVRVRVGDMAIFNRLVELSGLDPDTAIRLKEALDAIAECKAGKRPERHSTLIDDVDRLACGAHLGPRWAKVWGELARTPHSLSVIEKVSDTVVQERLASVRKLAATLDALGVTVKIDLCVVRSHEYYTGIAFEIDVFTNTQAFIEVGGGGRYDRLVGHFMADRTAAPPVPATGFAFGVERLVHLLDRLGLLGSDRSAGATMSMARAVADVLVIPQSATADGYREAAEVAAKYRAAGRAVDIYLGDPAHEVAYATARGITQSHTVTER